MSEWKYCNKLGICIWVEISVEYEAALRRLSWSSGTPHALIALILRSTGTPQDSNYSTGALVLPMHSLYWYSGTLVLPMHSLHLYSGTLVLPMHSLHWYSGPLELPMHSLHWYSGVLIRPMHSLHWYSGALVLPMHSLHWYIILYSFCLKDFMPIRAIKIYCYFMFCTE